MIGRFSSESTDFHLGDWIVRALLVLFLVNPNLAFTKEPPAISTGAKTLNVIFVVDVSNSMGYQNTNYESVITALRSLVTNPSLSNANFGLLTWGSNTCSWNGIAASCPTTGFNTTGPLCSDVLRLRSGQQCSVADRCPECQRAGACTTQTRSVTRADATRCGSTTQTSTACGTTQSCTTQTRSVTRADATKCGTTNQTGGVCGTTQSCTTQTRSVTRADATRCGSTTQTSTACGTTQSCTTQTRSVTRVDATKCGVTSDGLPKTCTFSEPYQVCTNVPRTCQVASSCTFSEQYQACTTVPRTCQVASSCTFSEQYQACTTVPRTCQIANSCTFSESFQSCAPPYFVACTGSKQVPVRECPIVQLRPKYQWIGLNPDPSAGRQAILNALDTKTDFYWGGATVLDNAMRFVDAYTSSAEFAKYNQACSTTMVIVLSDGRWNDDGVNEYEATVSHNIAAKLAARTPSIKTFAVAFGIDPAAVKGDTFGKLALAGGTKVPYGGLNVNADALAGTFLSLIQSVMFETFTTVAPLIVPKSGEVEDDLIVTPEFEYNPVGQWKGYLRADIIKADGTFGDNKWEFGNNLYATDPARRKIWTAACQGGACNAPNRNNRIAPNNLTAALPVSTLRAMFETTGTLSRLSADQDAINLLKFIRGEDVFDEDRNPATSKRWMLNDIYNSKPIFVGPPKLSFSTSPNYVGGDQYFYNQNPSAYQAFLDRWAKRKPVIYAGSNGGMVHAIHAVTGQELWAFVPPALLQNFKAIISSQPGTTNSIYGVDGPLVSKDVYVDGEWRTYLAVTLGKGARGFSVLDVTDPDLPLHVVSIHNDFPKPGPLEKTADDSFHPGAGRCLTRYLADGSTSPVCDTGGWFSALGYTVTDPVFSYAFSDNKYQPALIISAGDGDSITGTGPAVYAVNLSDQNAGSLISTNFTSDAVNALQGSYTRKTIASSVGNLLSIESTSGITSGSLASGTNLRSGTRVVEVVNTNTLRLDQSLIATIPAGVDLLFQVGVDNKVTVRPEVVHSGETALMQGKYGRLIVAPNNNGYIHSFNESDSVFNKVPFNANGKILVNSGTTPNNDRLINNSVTLSAHTFSPMRNVNILFGTGEKKFSALGKTPDNFVASFQDLDTNIFVSGAGSGWSKVCAAEIPACYRPTYVSPSPVQVNSTNFVNVSNALTASCPSESQQGWVAYFNQSTATDIVTGASKSCANGKLWQQIEVSSGVARILGYVPPAQSSANASTCVIGDSFIQFRDPACGYLLGGGGVYLSNTIIGGITTFRDKVYISLSRNRLANQQLPPSDKMIISGNKAVLLNPPRGMDPFKNPGVIKSKIRIQ
jgi:hypothetical protein